MREPYLHLKIYLLNDPYGERIENGDRLYPFIIMRFPIYLITLLSSLFPDPSRRNSRILHERGQGLYWNPAWQGNDHPRSF